MNEQQREKVHRERMRRVAVAALVRAVDALLDDNEGPDNLAAALLEAGNAIMLIAKLDPEEKAREIAERVLREVIARKGGDDDGIR